MWFATNGKEGALREFGLPRLHHALGLTDAQVPIKYSTASSLLKHLPVNPPLTSGTYKNVHFLCFDVRSECRDPGSFVTAFKEDSRIRDKYKELLDFASVPPPPRVSNRGGDDDAADDAAADDAAVDARGAALDVDDLAVDNDNETAPLLGGKRQLDWSRSSSSSSKSRRTLGRQAAGIAATLHDATGGAIDAAADVLASLTATLKRKKEKLYPPPPPPPAAMPGLPRASKAALSNNQNGLIVARIRSFFKDLTTSKSQTPATKACRAAVATALCKVPSARPSAGTGMDQIAGPAAPPPPEKVSAKNTEPSPDSKR